MRVELQADCYAGLWAHHAEQARRWLDAGDIDEALHAAAQIGDDTLQRNAGGAVAPESFTHGSSEQRVRWFRRGFDSGKVADCNTLDARRI
ncbi:neutral zinc metallopeptidase [Leptothrix cholodnii]|uniref:neutral zinc metallopeptidase n=1 Tax=Leptothrix cholodnii TaxID=34029 RepID=UPI000317DF91